MVKTVDISDTENEDWLRKVRRAREAAEAPPPVPPEPAAPKPLARPHLRDFRSSRAEQRDFQESDHPRGPDGKFGGGSPVIDLPGSMGVPRAEMPQIRSHDVQEFLDGLKAKGISVEKKETRVGDLKPTQSELNLDKLKAMAGKVSAEDKPIIVSSDHFVLDGHHRWGALFLKDKDQKITTFTVGMPMKALLQAAKDFPKSTTQSAGATGRTSEERGAPVRFAELRDPFDEGQHPRGPDGKFASGGGAPAASSAHGIVVDESKLPAGHTPAEHRKIAEDFIAMHRKGLPAALKELEALAPPGAGISGRTKDVENALEKLTRPGKGKYLDASMLGDGTGMRIVAKNIDEVKTAVAAIKAHYGDRILHEDNYIDKPQDSGYRSYHFDVKGPDGQVMEIQVRTPREHTWSEWAHNGIYKPSTPEQKAAIKAHSNEIVSYARQASDFYNKADLGLNPPPPPWPKEPEVIKLFGALPR